MEVDDSADEDNGDESDESESDREIVDLEIQYRENLKALFTTSNTSAYNVSSAHLGKYLLANTNKKFTYVGVDLFPNMNEKGLQYTCSRVSELPHTSVADYCICSLVLSWNESGSESSNTLAKIHQIQKPGGKVVIVEAKKKWSSDGNNTLLSYLGNFQNVQTNDIDGDKFVAVIAEKL